MAWAFDTIKESLGDWLGIPATDKRRLPDVVRGQIINFRHREIGRRGNFRSMETEATPVALAQGASSVALPSDWLTPKSIRYSDPASGDTIELSGITYSEFLSRYPDLTDSDTWGTPEFWSVSGSSLFIGPPAEVDGGYIYQTYTKIPADLDPAVQTSDITQLCGDALFFMCLADASVYILEEARYPGFMQRGEELLSEFISADARRIYEGRRPVSKEP